MAFKIWVDADSCPKKVKSVILKAAQKNNIKVNYVANRPIPFDFESHLFYMIVCQKTMGAADDYILENADKNDLVITRDLPFAKKLCDKKITVINDRGTLFDDKNLERMLRDRELNLQFAALGINMGKKFDAFSNKELQAFSACFDKVLQQKFLEN